MRAVRVSEDIVPVSDFKAQASEWLKHIAETGHPIVITQNGKAAAVVLSPVEFDRLTEQARFVVAVQEGLGDSDAGRTHAHADVKAELLQHLRGPTAPCKISKPSRTISQTTIPMLPSVGSDY